MQLMHCASIQHSGQHCDTIVIELHGAFSCLMDASGGYAQLHAASKVKNQKFDILFQSQSQSQPKCNASNVFLCYALDAY